jgi:hypothetical protein
VSQQKSEYEVVNEFSNFAHQIVDKYPEVFYGINVDKIRCVKIVNKNRSDKAKSLWKLQGVKMPMLLDCPYSYYVTIYSMDWDIFTEKQKYLLVAQILFGVSNNKDDEGKVISFDSHDYAVMQRTFEKQGIDYLENPSSPHIINDDIEWISSFKPQIGENKGD